MYDPMWIFVLGALTLMFNAATPKDLQPRWIVKSTTWPLAQTMSKLLVAAAPGGMDIAGRLKPAFDRALHGAAHDAMDDRLKSEGYDARQRGEIEDLCAGKLDLSDAYAVGIGSWDKFEVDWLYGEAPPGVDPDEAAREKADRMVSAGTRFITDIDSRADDTPTPWASMWDDGPDPVAELPRLMKVRAVALSNFGEGALHPGEPLANLRRKFVPVFLLHRYQVVAASKSIGGMDYSYKDAGDGHPLPAPVPEAMQEEALDNILAALNTSELTVSASLVRMMSSGINGHSSRADDIEVFDTAGASVFDPLAAADVAAQLTLDPLLDPKRLVRVYNQHASDNSLLGLDELLDKLLAATVGARKDAVGRRIAHRTLITLARVSRDKDTSADVAALINDRLDKTADMLAKLAGDADDAAWAHSMAHILHSDAAITAELAKQRPRTPAIPMGMPIGETSWLEDEWMDTP